MSDLQSRKEQNLTCTKQKNWILSLCGMVGLPCTFEHRFPQKTLCKIPEFMICNHRIAVSCHFINKWGIFLARVLEHPLQLTRLMAVQCLRQVNFS